MGLSELRRVFGLDPTKPQAPQIISVLWQSAVIFGGPLVGLIAIKHYPFLTTDRALYVGGISGVFFFFFVSFAMFRHDSDLLRFPLILRFGFRFGWGGAAAFLTLGLIGIANGYDTPLEARQVPVVAKHETLERDPARRTYYVAVRPWPGSRTVVELDGSRTTYDRLPVPIDHIDTPQELLNEMPDYTQVRLVVGRGRLGLEWLKGIEPIQAP